MKALIKLKVLFIGFCHCVQVWVKCLKINPLFNFKNTLKMSKEAVKLLLVKSVKNF